MLTTDRRRRTADTHPARRAQLPLLQRARLAELEHEGWRLRCIRDNPPQVILTSPKDRVFVLTAEGRLADPMGVTIRYR